MAANTTSVTWEIEVTEPGNDQVIVIESEQPSRTRTLALIISISLTTGLGSLLNGVLGVAIPVIAKDIGISNNLLVWPSSVFALSCGCTLLLFGALVDVFGARRSYLAGCFFQCAFSLACGLARTGIQLIIFRAFAGVAASMCLPAAVSLLTRSFQPGPQRNLAFACMGGGQPIGFAIGLSLGGVFANTIGWYWAFHMGTILNAITLCLALKVLPRDEGATAFTWQRLQSSVDLVGALLATASLATLSYILITLSDSPQNIAKTPTITLSVVSFLCTTLFFVWTARKERLGQNTILPLSLWKNRRFTTICLNVFLVMGAFNAAETLSSFFFQYVQQLSAMEALVRLLPAPIGGALASALMAAFVHRFRADGISIAAIVIASLTPLLMAIVDPKWTYWACCLPAMLLNAVGADTLYTISNLVITSTFNDEAQGRAGGVYNTVAQIGKSFGLSTSALVASVVASKSSHEDSKLPGDRLTGYRAAFWYCFAINATAFLIACAGMRGIGKIGLKKE